MKIKILHQYHNNMYDAAKALETLAPVEFLSYRQSNLLPGIVNTKPRTWGSPPLVYSPFHIWQLLNDTTCLILKDPSLPLNIVPFLLASLRRIPIIFIAQRNTNPIWRSASILAVTKQAYNSLQSKTNHLHYLPMPVDTRRFQQATIATSPHRILCVSKYQRRKNLELLLKAIAELNKNYFGLQLVIIGTQTSEPVSAGEIERIKKIVNILGLNSIVTLKQSLPYEEMQNEYARADLFVLPASQEPLGYAVVEAMAAGLPVVVSSGCGAASYVKQNVNGMVFSDQSQGELEQAIRQCLANAKQYGQASRAIAQDKHSPDRWLNYFREMLG